MKKERKTRKEKTFIKTFGMLLCSLIMIGFIGPVDDARATIDATMYFCIYNSDMQVWPGGTEALNWTISGESYYLWTSFLFGGYGLRMQGTGRTGPGGDYIKWHSGGGQFVHINNPEEFTPEIQQRYTGLGITDFTGFGNLALSDPAGVVYTKSSSIIGSRNRILVPWYSIAVAITNPVIPVDSTGTLHFLSGTTPEDATQMAFSVDDTGGGLTSNQVDIYVGEGLSAWNEWEFETGGNRLVDACLIIYIPDNYSTIQAAIDGCDDGDTIIVRDGTYTGDGNRDIDFEGKAITLRSENGPDNCIIDCDGTQENPHRGFYFHSGEEANSVVDGFTITNGCLTGGGADNGGGIACGWSSSPTITNCTISNNSSHYSGGGIYCNYYSNPTITNCTISSNSSIGRYGGGISCWNSSPIITSCIINGNSADFGGGGIHYCLGSNPTITDCIISNNSTNSNGGGIRCSGGASNSTITDCIISNNSADGDGGGIYCSESNLTIANCTISGNITGKYGYGDGGGLYCFCSNPIITNCIINGNSADDNGGGIACGWSSSPTITNCTISSNSANRGGGIYCSSDSEFLTKDSILWTNSPNEIYISGSPPVVTYSDIQGGWEGNGNIDADPLFIYPGYWDLNGTPEDPSDDFWVDGDYHLKSQAGRWDPNGETWVQDNVTSPCVDAADPSSDWTSELWPHGKRANMGAYGGIPQASMSLSDAGNIANLDNDPNDNVDLFDLSFFADKWCNEENLLAEDLSRDGLVSLIDFAIFAAHWFWSMIQGDGMGGSSSQQMELEQPLDMQPVQQIQPIEVQPVKKIDINELASQLEEIWLQDNGIREVISEDRWNEFIDKVRNPQGY